MTKRIVFLFSVLAAALLAACSSGGQASPDPASSGDSSASVSQAVSEEPPNTSSETTSADDTTSFDSAERVAVMDAYQFWGVVEDFAVSDDGKTVLMMNRADGTDFEPSLKVVFDDDTRMNFDSDRIGNGAFFEIYYGGKNDDGTVTAIAANDLGSVDDVLYNGTIVEIRNENGSGQMVLDPISEGGQRHAFNFGPETSFFVELNTLKPGDRVNVYHSMISTRSIPPQSPALEVRLYTAPEEGEASLPASETAQ